MMKRRTKIVITIGPAIARKLKSALKKVDIVRFNFSHGTHEQHKAYLDMVKDIERKLGKSITTIADLKGPEIRTKNKNKIEVKKGDVITLKEIGIKRFKELKNGDRVLIDDGTIRGIYEEGNILILNNGEITTRRKVTFPGINISLPVISEEDKKDINFINKHDFNIIAQSFVRNPNDVKKLRKITKKYIIAKIEHPMGVRYVEEIAKISDGLMVARGDLGIEMDYADVPIVQRQIINIGRKYGKPIIVATHMLKSMVQSISPTRAEVNDIAIAVYEGADAVMLSDETTKGLYPLEAINVIDKVVKRIEKEKYEVEKIRNKDVKSIMVKQAIKLSEILNIPIITFTTHGTTPRLLSSLRPNNNIYVFTKKEVVIKYLNIFFGIVPIKYENKLDIKNIKSILKKANIKHGIIVAGFPKHKETNTLILM